MVLLERADVADHDDGGGMETERVAADGDGFAARHGVVILGTTLRRAADTQEYLRPSRPGIGV